MRRTSGWCEAGDALAVGLADAPPGGSPSGLPAPLREALTLLDAATPAGAGAHRRGQARRPRPGAQAAGQGGAGRAGPRPRSACSPGRRYDVIWVERDDRRRARRGRAALGRRHAARATCTRSARSWPPRPRWPWAAASTPSPGRSACRPASGDRREPVLDDDGEESSCRGAASTSARRSTTAGRASSTSPRTCPGRPRPGLPEPAAEELVAAGQRAGWPYPRAVLLPPRGRAGRARCCGHRPTWRSWCRARRRCRCW